MTSAKEHIRPGVCFIRFNFEHLYQFDIVAAEDGMNIGLRQHVHFHAGLWARQIGADLEPIIFAISIKLEEA